MDWSSRIAEYLHLGPDSTGQRGGLLAALGTSAQSAVERYLGRTLDVQEYTESYDGTGKDTLSLRHDPIVSVSALSVCGSPLTVGDPAAPAFPPEPVEIEGPYLIRTDGGTFLAGRRTVTVTYRAGYEIPPPAIVQACVDWAALLFKDRDRVGLSSENVGGQSFGITHDVPKRIKETLEPWRRVYVP